MLKFFSQPLNILTMLSKLFALFGGYLGGSLPFGVWIPRLLGQGDPRTIGSANVGATNVYRLAGLKTALLVGFADFFKGFLPVLFAPHKLAVAVAAGCVLGHIFPWVLGFKGGKAVATACGVMMILTPFNTIIALGVWFLVWKKTRYVSLASLVATLIHLTLTWIFFSLPYRMLTLFTTALIFYAHRHNLKKLWQGKEYRFGH